MRKSLIIGWDAADWKVINALIEQGGMPHTAALIERGVMGNLSTLHPVLSPMLWTSIATGKRPYKHGVLGFTEPTPDGGGVQPVSQFSRKTKALWNILNQQGLTSSVVGWWPSHPVEPINGSMVSNHYQVAVGPPDRPWPLAPGTIHPPRLRAELAALRLNPNELSPAQVLPFVPLAAGIDQDKDQRLASVMKILAECASVHNAATWLIEHEPWDLFAVYYDAIDHFCHGFMRYHPPRREHISERDFELYSGVVEAAYRFHDMMLGVMLSMVPDDTTVLICSDHGFHPDHLRPVNIPTEPAGPAIEHRDFGIFILAGPNIKKDTLIHGASLLDIAPTLLTHWGMPVGEDMDGKPLLDVFETPPGIASIPSWDSVEGDDGRLNEMLQVDPLAAKEAMDQLIALGYVEEPAGDRREAVEQTSRELKYNLARSYMDAERYIEAIPLLMGLYEANPEQFRFGIQLAMCYRSTGDTRALRQLVERLTQDRIRAAEAAGRELERLRGQLLERQRAKDPDLPADAAPDLSLLQDEERREWDRQRQLAWFSRYDLDYLIGCVLMDEGHSMQALAQFQRAGQADPRRPGLHLQIGEALIRLHRFGEAEAAYRKALQIDPLNPHAHLGLARALLPQRRAKESAEHALETVRLMYEHPLAHYTLALALIRLGRVEDAERALRAAVAINPNFLQAHRVLLRLYRTRLSTAPGRLAEHQQIIREIRMRRRSGRQSARITPDPGLDELAGEAMHPLDNKPVDTAEPLIEPDMAVNSRWPGDEAATDFVTVVAGLPRSGTSMLMQMIESGGIPAVTDGKRVADRDNPRGYYEHEGATRLYRDKAWLEGAQGRCVKIVAQLLPALPGDYHYRVVFIERDPDEILRSQKVMLANLNKATARLDDAALKKTFSTQVRRVKVWMAQQPNLYTLYVRHRDVIDNPAATAERLAKFLNPEMDHQAMAAVVDARLYRQRSGQARESADTLVPD